MKLPKFKYLTLALLIVLPLSLFAQNATHQLDTKANWNRLEVHNHLDESITYQFGSGFDYEVTSHNYDSYHSKGGDSSTIFRAKVCEAYATGMMCTTGDYIVCTPYTYCAKSTEICHMSNVKLNADLIKRIDVNGYNQCIVTCLDGSNTSCLIK